MRTAGFSEALQEVAQELIKEKRLDGERLDTSVRRYVGPVRLIVRVHAMIPHLCLRALLPNSDRSPERTYSLCQICDLCGRVSLFDLRRGLRSFLQ